ncbi:MAG: S8 family serine peptidase [Vicinamibacteraceae bacterium]
MVRLSLGARRPSVAALVVVCLFAATSAWAQQPDARVLANPHIKQTLRVDPSTWQTNAALSPEVRAKVDATLARQRALKASRAGQEVKVGALLRAYQRASATADPAPASRVRMMRSRLPILGVEPDGSVRARIHLRGGPDAEAAIRALGIRIARVSEDRRVLYAALSAAEIDRVAAQAVVARISPIIGAQIHAGSVLSEGVAALRADRVQQQLRVSGKSIRIGVISDGIASIAAPTATGDIPATKAGLPRVELCPLNDNAGDEGTAMLEIVHDVAPGAALAFCPGFGDSGQQGLADAVTWLATEAFGGKGADVIVDDLAYLTEPFFQDGVIAQAVDAAAAHGVSYFSSAGNSADAHYEHVYSDVVPGDDFIFPLDTHDFGTVAGLPSDIGWDGLVAGNGNFFAAFMQWNDPFGGSANDYDIYIFDEDGDLAGDPASDFPIGGPGFDPQDGDDDPIEVAFVVNEFPGPGPAGTVKRFFMVIDRFFASPTSLLELQFNGFFAVDASKNIAEGSVFGHAASRGAMAVAATGAVENIDGTANPGLDVIEEYSSRGPSRIFFTPAGAPAPEVRRKPNTTATDGTSVTGVNFVTPFFGTSASAPHAAAVAVLLKDVNPGLNPAGIARILRETSLERGTPGFDTTWGFGLIDAYAAAKRAGQVGNSPLYFVCLPTRRGIQLVVPEFLIPASLALGLDFGRCD